MKPADPSSRTEPVENVQQTTCCIVGGGPGGLMLALFLARQGVPVTLLEAHRDFDRDFRGDTLHPSTLEVLDQLQLADQVLQLPHGKIETFGVYTPQGALPMASFAGLKTRFPYVAMLPQARFLDFICARAKECPSFRLVLGANVQRLVEENGVVRGVQYRDNENHWHEVRALLTVAADGRFSRIRHLTGLMPVTTSAPMDILWFRLPRQTGDVADIGGGFVGSSGLLVLLDRGDEWQIGYVVPKNGYKKVRAAGLEQLRASVAQLVPWLAGRTGTLTDWHQITVLSVESNRLKRWHRPGLLFIGDAAHTMSPVGGVGINYAIQDAVEAANVLTPALLAGRVRRADLAEVQRRREWPTRIIQGVQAQIQRVIIGAALDTSRPFRLPWLLRLLPYVPVLRRLPTRLIGFGPKRVHLEHVRSRPQVSAPATSS